MLVARASIIMDYRLRILRGWRVERDQIAAVTSASPQHRDALRCLSLPRVPPACQPFPSKKFFAFGGFCVAAFEGCLRAAFSAASCQNRLVRRCYSVYHLPIISSAPQRRAARFFCLAVGLARVGALLPLQDQTTAHLATGFRVA